MLSFKRLSYPSGGATVMREFWRTNRDVARQPKRTQGWCDCCDMAIVSAGQRCPACNTRIKPYRNKRELTTTGNTL